MCVILNLAIADSIVPIKIETEAIEAALVENFTYVETADVRRKLPDKILVTITDSVPTY